MALLTESWIADTFVLFLGSIPIIYLLLKRIYSYWDRKGFKTHPDYIYILGHFHKLFSSGEHLCEFVRHIYKSTDGEPFVGIYGFFRPLLLVRDPELFRSILVKDFAHFSDRGVHSDVVNDPLSGNLFQLSGQKWKDLRTKLSPTFTPGKLKAMFSTITSCGVSLQNHLEKVCSKGELLDVCESSGCHNTNVIASVAFGIEIDCVKNPNNEFRVCARKIFEHSFWNGLRTMLIFIQPKILSWLRIKITDSSVEKFIFSVVKENLDYREQNNVTRKDFFQLLIQLRNSGAVQQDNQWEPVAKCAENRTTLTIEELTAQSFGFFSVGLQTSSSAMSFCLYELAKQPKIQQRVCEEIDRALQNHDGKITHDSISDMKYLDACIDETLRKYAPLAMLNRVCIKDYKIPGTNKIIEKGTHIWLPIYALHRDEKYYADPDNFDPDRFSDENMVGVNQINRPYYAFGDGPRNCIGMRMGKMQTKVGLVLLLQKFKYELEDRLKQNEFKIDPNGFLLSALGGIRLHIMRR